MSLQELAASFGSGGSGGSGGSSIDAGCASTARGFGRVEQHQALLA